MHLVGQIKDVISYVLLTSLSVPQNVSCLLIELLINSELEKTSKERCLSCYEVLSQHLLGGTEKNN